MHRITARTRTQAPSTAIVSLAELYLHLHLDTDGSPPTHPEDTNLATYTQSATDEIDAGDGWLGRALLPQQWRVRYNGFPCWTERNPDSVLRLPYPPLISVDLVRYRDAGGTYVTMTEGTDYEVREGDPVAGIAPLYLQSWPVTADVENAVEVTFTCGYDAAASPANPLPDLVKAFVLVSVGNHYIGREEFTFNQTVGELPWARNALRTLKVEGP